MNYAMFAFLIFVSLLTLSVTGCGPVSNIPTTKNESPGDHDHREQGQHEDGSLTDMEKMKAELAKLSPEDAESAEKQHICPVSGEMLGTMGPPKKVEVNGREVWICCDGCEDQLLENSDEYLAKLGKAED